MLIFTRMILLSSAQTAYVAVFTICVPLIISLIIYLVYKNVHRHKHIKELTYLKLKRFCESNDYLLLNEYRIEIDDSHVGMIDHIVVSDKYIFIINDFPISGVIKGNYSADELNTYDKNGAGMIVNPLNYNINMAKRLALYNDLSQDLVKGLVVINDDSKAIIENGNDQFKIVRLKELRKTIKQFDKDNVKKLKEEAVVAFIKYLDKQNQ